jgi:antitoxin YobK
MNLESGENSIGKIVNRRIIMSALEKAFKIIENYNKEADFLGVVPEEEIISCEKKLNLKLPKSYKEFVLRYGVGGIFGEEIYGLGIPETGVPNVIWITKDMRETDDIPNHFVPIYNTGYDNEYYCLDCSKIVTEDDDKAPIVLFIPGLESEQQSFEQIEDSFGEFLYNLLIDAIDE